MLMVLSVWWAWCTSSGVHVGRFIAPWLTANAAPRGSCAPLPARARQALGGARSSAGTSGALPHVSDHGTLRRNLTLGARGRCGRNGWLRAVRLKVPIGVSLVARL